jgi:hypothetical protein
VAEQQGQLGPTHRGVLDSSKSWAGANLARIGHHYPGGVNHKTNVYIEKQCRVQCNSNVRIGKKEPYIEFLGPMYGPMYSFPIKPCLNGLIGRNANQKSNVRTEKL